MMAIEDIVRVASAAVLSYLIAMNGYKKRSLTYVCIFEMFSDGVFTAKCCCVCWVEELYLAPIPFSGNM